MAAVDRARELGADVVTGVRVQSVVDMGDHVEIRTADRTWRVGRLVLAVGSWIGKVLGAAELPFWVERQVQGWFPVDEITMRHAVREIIREELAGLSVAADRAPARYGAGDYEREAYLEDP